VLDALIEDGMASKTVLDDYEEAFVAAMPKLTAHLPRSPGAILAWVAEAMGRHEKAEQLDV
jgi:hypothetical protein